MREQIEGLMMRVEIEMTSCDLEDTSIRKVFSISHETKVKHRGTTQSVSIYLRHYMYKQLKVVICAWFGFSLFC